jgi:hypothetical protein
MQNPLNVRDERVTVLPDRHTMSRIQVHIGNNTSFVFASNSSTALILGNYNSNNLLVAGASQTIIVGQQ